MEDLTREMEDSTMERLDLHTLWFHQTWLENPAHFMGLYSWQNHL
jgi:hypothetical protein